MAWIDDRRPPRIAALVVDRARVIDSDAETLRALGASMQERDILTHARWVEILGREALSLRFYRALEHGLGALAESSSHGSIEARREHDVSDIRALTTRVREELEQFALAATALEGKDLEVLGWGDASAALDLVRASVSA